jgi:hypothetical protein
MGKRAEALELARYLAFEGQDAEQIARALQAQCGLGEREASRMALNVLAPSPEPPPGSGRPSSHFWSEERLT